MVGESLKELAEDCSTIITILGYPEDVRQVYLGEDGLVSSAKEGSILIDMTTSDPQLAKEIYSEAKKEIFPAWMHLYLEGILGLKKHAYL